MALQIPDSGFRADSPGAVDPFDVVASFLAVEDVFCAHVGRRRGVVSKQWGRRSGRVEREAIRGVESARRRCF